MKVVISGASGLIGRALVEQLRWKGAEIWRLVRAAPSKPDPCAILWSPLEGQIEKEKLEGADLVIHLGGETISGYWTKAKKRRIQDSRVIGTRTLCRALCDLQSPPRTWLSASAIGIYGHREDEWLTEQSGPGEGFLVDVARGWEAATHPAGSRGIRTVLLRFGVVLSKQGGALKQMLTPFKCGLGGRVGSGRQYLSWISLNDAVRAIQYLADKKDAVGPYNLASPHAVTNRQLTKALGKALHRPTVLPLPEWAVGLLLGEMGRELLLTSARVVPQRLEQAGFTFEQKTIEEHLAQELGG